jgi:hypothetical protein
MTRRINVNPGQYKTRGREDQGDQVPHEGDRRKFTQAKATESRRQKKNDTSSGDAVSGPAKKSRGNRRNSRQE